jgi:hypothetical protein
MNLGGGEFTPSVRFDPPEIQRPGDVGQSIQSYPIHRFVDDSTEFPVSVIGQFLPSCHGFGNGFLIPGIPEFLPPSFGGLESGFSP